jgi:uroporphyrinogen decarboxylase
MTPREQYIATLLFEKPDRVYFDPGYGRKSTRERWYQEGLPADVTDYVGYARQLLGIEPVPTSLVVQPGVDFRMIPHFEEKVLERKPGTQVVQDWKGNICEISDEFDVSYLREAIDFVTRNWIKCPVESRADWEQMKRRYVVDDPKRFPADFADRARRLRDRTYPAGIVFPGPFWQLREWLGFENLCMLLVDDPGFAQEMIDFWERFVVQVLERTLDQYVPDFVMIQEDMAYKEKPMIGPDMSRQVLLPTWRRWGKLIRGAGVPIYEVDSDGYAGSLIPVWIEAGFNCNSPQEVAAGNDLPAYRQQYGTQMAYRGGVDKRAMAKGGAALKAEIDRLTPVIKAGGFIPSCDHGIPHDVSWPNFLEYCRLLAEATGWLP